MLTQIAYKLFLYFYFAVLYRGEGEERPMSKYNDSP